MFPPSRWLVKSGLSAEGSDLEEASICETGPDSMHLGTQRGQITSQVAIIEGLELAFLRTGSNVPDN